jgi:uncharacterized FlgJ-related protein
MSYLLLISLFGISLTIIFINATSFIEACTLCNGINIAYGKYNLIFMDNNNENKSENDSNNLSSVESIESRGKVNVQQLPPSNESKSSNMEKENNVTAIPLRSKISPEELAKLKELVKNRTIDNINSTSDISHKP